MHAGPGALLCTWPVLLKRERFTRRVAATIVLAYSVPFPAFRELMQRYDSVNSGAWQACGATLALMTAGDATFKEYTFNELQTLFRSCQLFCPWCMSCIWGSLNALPLHVICNAEPADEVSQVACCCLVTTHVN